MTTQGRRKKYKILFIDEQKEEHDVFKDHVDDSAQAAKLEIETLFPSATKEELLDVIFKSSPDAVITDYELNAYKKDIEYNVPYTGVELMNSFFEKREGFPFFVLTSFDDQAVRASQDVNKIYVKNILHQSEDDKVKSKASFLDRIVLQIEHYQKQIADAESEILVLIERQKEKKTTLLEEERLIELDNFLERSIDKNSAVPKELKKISIQERLGELQSKFDELLKRIDSNATK